MPARTLGFTGPLFLGSLLLGSFLAATSPASAGLRVVQGEGYAAIAGNDVAQARKAALAEALYNAAGRVKTKIRGAGHLDTRGVMTEESSMLVEGSLRDHRIVQEYRQGSRYVVVVEALAETDGGACGTKRVDLDVRPISVHVAPGLPGHVLRAARESVDRAVQGLATGSNFRATDNRDLPLAGGAEAARTDYATLLHGGAPNPSGYSISGRFVVERRRQANLLGESVDIVATLTLGLRDNSDGSLIDTITVSRDFNERTRLFGTPLATGSSDVDLASVWQAAAADLDAKLGCRPLRAKILDVNAGLVTLSVGSEHGIRSGDYFLLDLPGRRNGDWQVIKIERTSATTARGRTLKPAPAVPLDAMATLLQ